MKYNYITIAEYKDSNENCCSIVEDKGGESAFLLNFSYMDITHLENTFFITCELMEATSIDYINHDYVEAIRDETLFSEWHQEQKAKAFDLLVELTQWED